MNTLLLNPTDLATIQFMKDLVLQSAKKLLYPNNQVTNLEIKVDLITTHKHFRWVQDFIHQTMIEYSDYQGLFTYTFNGTYRTYSDPNFDLYAHPLHQQTQFTKTVALNQSTDPAATQAIGTVSVTPSNVSITIDKAKALDLMKNNNGHFFTATFIDDNGNTKSMNCQYSQNLQDPNRPNIVIVRESGMLIKKQTNFTEEINLLTLKQLNIGKQKYIIS
jgi:hypothetical protein